MDDVQEELYNDAKSLYEAGKFDELITFLKPLCDTDEGWALTMMGYLYASGDGVDIEEDKAFEFWSRAAKQNDRGAQLMLGHHYSRQGDMSNARVFLKLAHDNGHPSAAAHCAKTYLHDNPHIDSDEFLHGLMWLRKSSELGEIESILWLANLLEKVGDEKSLAEQVSWNLKASELGDARGSYNCGRHYEYGIGTSVDFVKARQYYGLAAELGIIAAMHNLAALNYNGKGGDVDKSAAFSLYNTASSNGSYLSTLFLGRMFEKGEAPSLKEGSVGLRNAMTILAKHQMDLVGVNDGAVAADFSNFLDSSTDDEKKNAVEILEAIGESNPEWVGSLLSELYSDGIFVAKDAEKAEHWKSKVSSEEPQIRDPLFATMFSEKTPGVTTSDDVADRERRERQECSEALQALNDGKYDIALKLLQPLVNQGNVIASYDLAKLHLEGFIENPDINYARELLESLSERGDAGASRYLGHHYATGTGLSKDDQKAFIYYEMAAKRGDLDAMCSLGYMHLYGLGTDKNVGSAKHWLGVAAENNYGRACYGMGTLYLSDEVDTNVEMAVKFFQRGVRLGDTYCQNHLGVMYRDGAGCPQDYEQAFHLFKLSADNSNMMGQYYLGCLYLEGLHVEKDTDLARKYLELSAEQHCADAIHALGAMYGEGTGVEKDRAKSIELYKRSAVMGHPLSNANLGVIYINGDGVERDLETGVAYLTEAARLGDVESKKNLIWLKNEYGIDTSETPSVQ